MQGEPDFLFLSGVVMAMAWRWFIMVAPLLVVVALWWAIDRTELIVNRLFPHLEWERNLGWLNIQATRRAEAAMRWLGYAIYAILAGALYGIVWGAEGVPMLANWPDPWVMGEVAMRMPVLVVCLGVWLLYLGCGLIPKLRLQREVRELERFRATMKPVEDEGEGKPVSRVKSPLKKPRTGVKLAPGQTRRRR